MGPSLQKPTGVLQDVQQGYLAQFVTGSTSNAEIQVIPVDLFAGFTCFHSVGISTNNAAHTGSAYQVGKEMPGNGIFPLRNCRLMCVYKQEINLNEEGWR